MAFSPLEKYNDWWLEKVRSGARPHLEQGELVKAGTYGQEAGSFWASLICFWRPRLIVVTDSNVLLFKSGIANSTKAGDLIGKRPLASQPVARDGRGLVFEGRRIFPPPGAKRETDEVVSATVIGVAPAATAQLADSTPPPGGSIPPPA